MSNSHPTDLEIIDHQNLIRNIAICGRALVGSATCFQDLLTEYSENTSFKVKLKRLESSFNSVRRIRPDGNCFYRAYLFGVIEQVLVTTTAVQGLSRLRTKFKALCEECKVMGYDAFAVDDFFELLDEQISNIIQTPTVEKLSSCFSDDSVDGYLMTCMRCICGAYVKKYSEEFQFFLPEKYASIETFVRNEVDPMYRDCDQIQIVALTRALAVPLRIVYLDQSEGDSPTIHTFEDAEGKEAVVLLYKPGHYDLIY